MDKRTFYVIEFPLVLLAGILIGLVLAEDFARESRLMIFFRKPEEEEKREEETTDE